MFPSILTAILFAASGISGRRSAVAFGSLRGNLFRLLIAAATLGVIASWLGPVDFASRAARRLLVSGVVGFGLGDVALFLAYPRLGARLTLLINLCSAPLFGAIADALLTGARVRADQGLAALAIVAGVALALLSGVRLPADEGSGRWAGAIAALVAGFGQGVGAGLSRWAKVAARHEGLHLAPLQEAWIRVLPGLAFGVLAWWIFGRGRRDPDAPRPGVGAVPWLLGAALFGPVLGVTCFQWALGQAPGAIVLSITATTPILVMPLAAWIEKDRPGYAAVAGGLIAVAGVVWMALLSAA